MIINEHESDKTSRRKQFSELQTWRNHSLNATRKEVDKKIEHPKKVDQRWNENFQEDEAYQLTRETARYRDEDRENKAKIGGPRTESAFDVRMPETTSAQEVPQRITASR